MDPKQQLEKFRTSRQASVKLEIAMEEWFREDLPADFRPEYERYLRSRITPAVQALIQSEDTEKLQIFRELGWFPLGELDRLLDFAAAGEKCAAAVWLLALKQETTGFQKPDFSL